MLATVTLEGEREDSLRRAETQDGAQWVERLLESSPEQRSDRHQMESSPTPVRDHVAEFRVDDDGTSTVVWTAEFEPTLVDFRTIGNIRAFLKAGLAAIEDLHRPVLKYTS